jgi:hypothetical protein
MPGVTKPYVTVHAPTAVMSEYRAGGSAALSSLTAVGLTCKARAKQEAELGAKRCPVRLEDAGRR